MGTQMSCAIVEIQPNCEFKAVSDLELCPNALQMHHVCKCNIVYTMYMYQYILLNFQPKG